MKFVLIFVLLFGLLPVSTMSQQIRDVCGSAESIVAKTFPNSVLEDRHIFSESCKFWWKTKNSGNLELYIYRFASDEEGKKAVDRDIKTVFSDLTFSKSDTFGNNFDWDDSFHYKGSESDSSILIFRKGSIVFEAFSPRPGTVLTLQKKMSEVF